MSKVTKLVHQENERRRKMIDNTGKNLNGVFIGHKQEKDVTDEEEVKKVILDKFKQFWVDKRDEYEEKDEVDITLGEKSMLNICINYFTSLPANKQSVSDNDIQKAADIDIAEMSFNEHFEKQVPAFDNNCKADDDFVKLYDEPVKDISIIKGEAERSEEYILVDNGSPMGQKITKAEYDAQFKKLAKDIIGFDVLKYHGDIAAKKTIVALKEKFPVKEKSYCSNCGKTLYDCDNSCWYEDKEPAKPIKFSQTPEEYFESRNGGKSAEKMMEDDEMITPTYAVTLISEYILDCGLFEEPLK